MGIVMLNMRGAPVVVMLEPTQIKCVDETTGRATEEMRMCGVR
jgi:hypothetical protein